MFAIAIMMNGWIAGQIYSAIWNVVVCYVKITVKKVNYTMSKVKCYSYKGLVYINSKYYGSTVLSQAHFSGSNDPQSSFCLEIVNDPRLELGKIYTVTILQGCAEVDSSKIDPITKQISTDDIEKTDTWIITSGIIDSFSYTEESSVIFNLAAMSVSDQPLSKPEYLVLPEYY